MWNHDHYRIELRSLLRDELKPSQMASAVAGHVDQSSETFPYPVFPIKESLSLHVVPGYGNHQFWIVEEETGNVLASHSSNCDYFWYYPKQRKNCFQNLRRQIPGRKQPSGFMKALRETVENQLCTPFFTQYERKLLSPSVQWLLNRTNEVNVELAISKSRGRPRSLWIIQLTPPEKSRQDSIELEYYTKTLVSQSKTRIKNDLRRPLSRQFHLSQNDWLNLSEFWITEANIRDFSNEDVIASSPEDYSLRSGYSGVYHLYFEEKSETMCHNNPLRGSQQPFSFDGLPVKARLCSHCSRQVKHLRISQKFQAEG